MIHLSYLPTFPILSAIRDVALRNQSSSAFSFARSLGDDLLTPTRINFTQLFTIVFGIASQLLSANHHVVSHHQGGYMLGGGELQSKPVGLISDGREYTVIGAMGIWLSGGVIVPIRTEGLRDGSTETIAQSLVAAGVQIILIPPTEYASQHGDQIAERVRSMGHFMEVVRMDVTIDEEEKSYETQPPIWMVEQWADHAPREDAKRDAVILLDHPDQSKQVTHSEIITMMHNDTPLPSLPDLLLSLKRLSAGEAL